MQLKKVKLQNFRSYADEVEIEISDLTAFVGRNDAGKSSILEALDIFFNEPKGKPDTDDYNVGNAAEECVITCLFSDLPSSLVIDDATPTSLAKEHMLNGEGLLEIKKLFRKGSSKVQVFAVANHPRNADYADLLTLTNAKLKAKANALGVPLDGLDQRVNTQLRLAIWEACDDLQLGQVEIELAKESAKALWEKLKPCIPVYALFRSDRPSTDQDAEAQDPMKMAIREAIANQAAALKTIQDNVEAQVQTIADQTVSKIMEMSPELAQQLKPRIQTKKWDTVFSVSLTGEGDIPINKRGSGTRRLVLLNFFRAKAEQDCNGRDTGVIYAIEEPETSQHPNNQHMLIDAFDDLVSDGTCQVLLTTHTPVLARRFSKERLRYVVRNDGCSAVTNVVDEEIIRNVADSLGILPNHDVKVFVGVEGKHDINFLRAISEMLSKAGENVPDLKQADEDGRLVFIPCGGSSIELWVARLNDLGIPEYYIFDRDEAPPADPHYKADADKLNELENVRAQHTTKRELENYIQKDAILQTQQNYTGTGDDPFENVPELFAQAVHEAGNGGTAWADLDKEKKKKKEGKAKRHLNTTVVASMTPEQLSAVDPDDDVRGWLANIGEYLNNG